MEKTGNDGNPKCRQERRRKNRTECSIPAKVRGIDAGGHGFDLAANLDNISGGGIHLRVAAQVEEQSPLSISFFIPYGDGRNHRGTSWEAVGIIRRVEPQTDGSNGLGIEFKNYRQI